jgi:hypothetical protein
MRSGLNNESVAYLGLRCQQELIEGFRDLGIEEFKYSEIRSTEYHQSLNS